MFKDDSNYIMKEATIIREKVKNNVSKDEIIVQHKKFYESYFKLFDSLLEYNFDMNMLNFILNNRDKIDNNNINEIDDTIMEHLKEKYIKPVVNNQ